MGSAISETLLSRIGDLVADRMGLYFPRERYRDLLRGVGSASKEFGFEDIESCTQWLLSSPLSREQMEILASHLTIGETHFFRGERIFEILKESILLELIRSRQETEKRLRIWSAGCCTGEEPYSIAILLTKLIPDLKEWSITILATDINPHFLRKASQAEYSKWSFRGTSPELREKYFIKKREGRYEILPPIKRMVTFSYLNLAEDAYPSLLNNTNAMDIIFCHNVLMYFAPELVKKVIQKFYLSLMEDGWLIVSPAETSPLLYSQFVTANFPGATLYRKGGKRMATSEALPCEPGSKTEVWSQTSLDTVVQKFPEVSLPPIPEDGLTPPSEVRAEKMAYEEARSLYQQGKYVETTEKLLRLLLQEEHDSKAASLLVRVYADQGKLTEAMEWCERAIAGDRLNPGLYYLRAIILQELGAIEEAVTSLKRTLYLDQNFVLAHFALGNLSLQQEKLKEAERHFQNAYSLLKAYGREEILPESGGTTAGRLMEIISSQGSGVGNLFDILPRPLFHERGRQKGGEKRR